MTYHHNNKDPNLNNLHHAMEYRDGVPHVRVNIGSDTITINGDINVDNVTVDNLATDPVPISSNKTQNASNNPLYVNIGNTGTVSLSQSTLTALETINVNATQTGTWTVGLDSTSLTALENINATVSGTVELGTASLSALETVNAVITDGGGSITVDGNVTATITGTPVFAREESASTVTAFGEQYGITITPVIQLDSIYGVTDEVIQTYTSGAGSSAGDTPTQSVWTVESGTSPTGYGVLRSRRFLRYRPGQGALTRFTAAFSPTVAQTSQRAGLFNQENALQIGIHDDGVNGPRFGIRRASGGKAQVVVLTINTAPTGSQTVTVTLNSVPFTVAVTAGTTTATAVAIAARVGGFTNWLIDQVDNTVVFMSSTLGPKSGTYSLSSSGTGTLAAGTFSTEQAGVAQTDNWTYQTEFNIDRLDGTKGTPSDIGKNPSGMTLHSEYLNVYQINFRWLGAGEIRFAIENQINGQVVFFHRIHYTNQYTVPHLLQPSFKIGYVVYNLGSTTSAKVIGASMMGAIEGDIRQNELNRSCESIKSNLTQNTLHHLLTLRNPYVTNGAAGALNGNYVLNAKEIILKDISIALQGQDPGIVYIFYNADSFSGTHSFTSQPKDNGIVSTVDGTLNTAVDTAVCRFVTAINGESQYKLSDFRIAIPPGDSISIGIRSTNGITRLSVALVFSED